MHYVDGSPVQVGDYLCIDEWNATVEEIWEPSPGDPMLAWMQEQELGPGILVIVENGGAVFYECAGENFHEAVILKRASATAS